jgi:hypothetical protein
MLRILRNTPGIYRDDPWPADDPLPAPEFLPVPQQQILPIWLRLQLAPRSGNFAWRGHWRMRRHIRASGRGILARIIQDLFAPLRALLAPGAEARTAPAVPGRPDRSVIRVIARDYAAL